MIFEPGVKVDSSGAGPAYWFLFRKEELLVYFDQATGVNSVPYFQMIGNAFPEVNEVGYLGLCDGRDCYFGTVTDGADSADLCFEGLRKLYGSIDDSWYWLANRAYHLIGWRRKNRFCGCCGESMSPSPDEVAMVCGKCGNTVYPRISPAVIVAITKGDKILLALATRFAGKMYSVIAGFVEPGETLEECVRREVMEEVGLRVENIRYFASQPWPYPDSLMIAFTAEHESGDIRIDNREISDARWYSRDDLPELPSRVSVARKLIDAWLNS